MAEPKLPANRTQSTQIYLTSIHTHIYNHHKHTEGECERALAVTLCDGT